MALSPAEKQRRYRERKRREAREVERRARGAPPPPPDPTDDDLPAGAYRVMVKKHGRLDWNGRLRAKAGHYQRLDGTFARIPQDLLDERWPEAHARIKARKREREPLTPEQELAPLYEQGG